MEAALGIFIFSTLFISLLWKNFKRLYKKSCGNHSDSEDLNRKGWKTMKNIPSPPSLPIFGNFFYFLKCETDPLKLSLKMVEKYGNIMKANIFGDKFVYLNEPWMIQKVLSSSNPNHLNKYKRIYESLLTGRMVNGVAIIDYNQWHSHRRIMSRSFNFQSLQTQLTLMNKHSKQIVSEIEKFGTQNVKNMDELVHFRMMKLILNTIMDIEECDTSELRFFQDQLELLIKAINDRVLKPWLLLPPIWKVHPLRRRVDYAIKQCDVFLGGIMEKYKNKIKMGQSQTKYDTLNAQDKNDADILGNKRSKLLNEELIESGMNDEEIMNEIMTIFIAGHETTSVALMHLLFQLALNPEIQDKCREEIDLLFDSKLTKNDPDLTMDDLTNLKYLERCVFETLRFCPVIPSFVRRLDAPLELSEDLVLPKGISIAIAPWALHRDPRNFPDPERFDPDRFLPENCKKRHAFSYIPFSGGPRNCIGWKTALMTIKVMGVFIIRNFTFQTMDRLEDVEFRFQISVTTKKSVNLVFKKRV